MYAVKEPALNAMTICEFETDCGHTISAMRDGLGREWVVVKKPDLNEQGEVQYIQTAFLKAGGAEGAAERIFNQLQNSIIA